MGPLERGLLTVRAHPEAGRFAGPCSEKVIARAQRAVRRGFPPSYRRFVRELGAGSIGRCEFYGVIDGDEAAPDAVATTLAERAKRALPAGLVVVGRPADGGWYVLDCAAVRTGEEAPVLAWAPGVGGWVA